MDFSLQKEKDKGKNADHVQKINKSYYYNLNFSHVNLPETAAGSSDGRYQRAHEVKLTSEALTCFPIYKESLHRCNLLMLKPKRRFLLLKHVIIPSLCETNTHTHIPTNAPHYVIHYSHTLTRITSSFMKQKQHTNTVSSQSTTTQTHTYAHTCRYTHTRREEIFILVVLFVYYPFVSIATCYL